MRVRRYVDKNGFDRIEYFGRNPYSYAMEMLKCHENESSMSILQKLVKEKYLKIGILPEIPTDKSDTLILNWGDHACDVTVTFPDLFHDSREVIQGIFKHIDNEIQDMVQKITYEEEFEV